MSKDKKKDKYEKAIHKNQKVLEKYVAYCKNKGLTEESIKAIEKNDIPLFLRFISGKKLEDITHHNIGDFLTYCAEERNNQNSTLARKFTVLNSFFKIIIKLEYVKMKNPLDKVDKPKYNQKVRPYLTQAEYDEVINYLDSVNDIKGAALISFYCSAACRLSEGWQQNIDNLDMKKRKFKVLGKGDKERICVFSEDAKARVLKYLETRTDTCEALFVNIKGKRWAKRDIQRYMKNLTGKIELEKNLHPHLFRHTRAMDLYKQGVPLDKIQKMLGHANISTTQIYAHMDIDDVQSVVDELDKKKTA